MMWFFRCSPSTTAVGLLSLSLLRTTVLASPKAFPDCPSDGSSSVLPFEPEEEAPSPAPSLSLSCTSQTSNARGWYTSARAPCVFQFHKAAQQEDETDIQYSTSGLCGADTSFLTLKDYVAEWQDECVGDFARCYSLEHHKSIFFDFLCAKGWNVPEGATHISVDCSEDKDLVLNSVSRLELEQVRDHRAEKIEHVESKLFDVMLIMSCFVVGVFSISQWIIKPLLVLRHHPPCRHRRCRRTGSGCQHSLETMSLTRESSTSTTITDSHDEEGDYDDENIESNDHFHWQVPADFDAVPIPAIPAPPEHDGETGVGPIAATAATDFDEVPLATTTDTPTLDYDGVPIAAATIIPDYR